ncbi:MAG: hypothetical protein L0Z53_28120 [Acidobacteriales bacterium]|nr:hypothetical protein [Terriglobales bacterium]
MKATLAIGLIAVTACAVWALAPLPVPSSNPLQISGEQPSLPSTPVDSTTIDSEAFARARLWNPKQLPQPAPMQAQAQPLRLQLIGIIHAEGRLQAALYDPDADRLLIVSSGQTIKGHQVTKITAKTVELSSGQSKLELHLKETTS